MSNININRQKLDEHQKKILLNLIQFLKSNLEKDTSYPNVRYNCAALVLDATDTFKSSDHSDLFLFLDAKSNELEEEHPLEEDDPEFETENIEYRDKLLSIINFLNEYVAEDHPQQTCKLS